MEKLRYGSQTPAVSFPVPGALREKQWDRAAHSIIQHNQEGDGRTPVPAAVTLVTLGTPTAPGCGDPGLSSLLLPLPCASPAEGGSAGKAPLLAPRRGCMSPLSTLWGDKS